MGRHGGYDEEALMRDVVEKFLDRGMVPREITGIVERLHAEGKYEEALDLVLEAREQWTCE